MVLGSASHGNPERQLSILARSCVLGAVELGCLRDSQYGCGLGQTYLELGGFQSTRLCQLFIIKIGPHTE